VRTVFLDRDGVINRNRPDHVKSWAEFEFLPGALDALAELRRRGYRTIVVTNQAGINRGLLTKEAVEEIDNRMIEEVARRGGCIEAVLYCPHRPEEACGCRKPRPGLLLRAQQEFGVDLGRAHLIGDYWTDIAAAVAVGCEPILVLTGRGREACRLLGGRYPVVRDLRAAVNWILQREMAEAS